MSIIKEIILKPKFSAEDLNATAQQATTAMKPVNELGKDIEHTFRNAFTSTAKEVDNVSARINILTKSALELKREGKQNTAEYKKLREEITKLNVKPVENVTQKVVTMKTELLKTKNELVGLDAGSERFQELSDKAADLQNKISGVNQRVKNLASSTQGLDTFLSASQGIAGAFSVAQGATALFGKENEDVQKALLKVQASLSVLNGLQAVAATLNKDSAFSVGLNATATKVYTFVTTGATAATNAFRAALIATGAGAVVAGIALLVVYWEDIAKFIGISNDELEKQKMLQKQIEESTQKRRDEIEEYNNRYKGTVGLAKLDLELAQKRGASEEEILKLKRFANLTEQDVIKNRLRYNGLTGDALALEETKLKFLQAELEGLEKVKLKREEISKISVLSNLTGLELSQIEIVANRAGQLYIDILKKKLAESKPDFAAQLGELLGQKVDVPPLQIPIEIQNAIGLKNFLREELPAAAQGFANDFFQIGANIRQQSFNDDMKDLEARKDARLQNEALTQQERLVIDKQYQDEVNRLRTEQAKREQQAAIAQAIINGALGVTRLAAQTPPPSPAFFAGLALLAVQTASKVAIIKSTPLPAFADGVIDFKGRGTAKSDSNVVRISRGESVMTAEETSQHREALQAIRNRNFEAFITQKAFETERLRPTQVKREQRRTSLRKVKKDRIIIDNYEQIGGSIASKLNHAGYTKRR